MDNCPSGPRGRGHTGQSGRVPTRPRTGQGGWQGRAGGRRAWVTAGHIRKTTGHGVGQSKHGGHPSGSDRRSPRRRAAGRPCVSHHMDPDRPQGLWPLLPSSPTFHTSHPTPPHVGLQFQLSPVTQDETTAVHPFALDSRVHFLAIFNSQVKTIVKLCFHLT